MNAMTDPTTAATGGSKTNYNRFLLLVAGLGGLLYGVDVGIIAGALPYLEATFKDAATGQTLNAGQLSFIVAAVLLGSVISTLFAGMLADLVGRKKMMILSGLLFVVSIPMIALAHGYWPLVFGRLLQGISGGLIGVVIPLYLAECLGASNRGKGTGIFQWLLTLGIVAAAVIGCFSATAWTQSRRWATRRNCLPSRTTPGAAFSGCRCRREFCLSSAASWSPNRRAGCSAADKKTPRSPRCCVRARDEQAEIELQEMEETAAAETGQRSAAGEKIKESLLHRKYVIPFRAGLRHPRLQPGHRRQFHHRLQRRRFCFRPA